MYKCEVYKSVEIDLYEDGCQLEGGNDFGCIETITAKSIAELVKKVKYSFSCIANAEPFEGRLESGARENADGFEPRNSEIQAWKDGELTLYFAQYSFYFSEVTQAEIFPSVMIGFFKEESVS